MSAASAITLDETTYATLRGKSYGPFEVEMTAEEIAAFARSTDDNNSILYERETARDAGYDDVVAPSTLLLAPAAKHGQSANAPAEFGFTSNQTFYGQQDFEDYRPICADAKLRGQKRRAEVLEKKGGTLLFVITEIDSSDAVLARVPVGRQALIIPLRERQRVL